MIIITVIVGLITLFSGCVDNQELIGQTSPISSGESTQVSKSVEENKIVELETEIDSLQKQINELQTRIDRVDLLKPSEKSLIPNVPFKIEVYFAEWQPPMIYWFKENGLEIDNAGHKAVVQYELFPNNNTIKISSKKYSYYGLVLYDDYVTSIYENGWIEWVHKYKIIQPKYNSITQKYEFK